jgi:hypothetical protein
MRRILTFEFVQNNDNYRSGFTLLKKRSEMVSNLLKRWRDDFATVKRHVARMGEVRGAYNILVGRPEGRRPLRRPRRRWEDHIKMDLRVNRVWGCGLDLFGSG